MPQTVVPKNPQKHLHAKENQMKKKCITIFAVQLMHPLLNVHSL